MRVLTELLAISSAKCEADEVKVLVVSGAGLTHIGQDIVLPQLCLLDASNNNLSQIKNLFGCFPALWWARLGNNRIQSLALETMPMALGLLDISTDQPVLEDLSMLKCVNIMRLSLHASPRHHHDETISILHRIPFIWVLNNDYLPFKLVQTAALSAPEEHVRWGGLSAEAGAWTGGSSRLQPRETILVNVCREMPVNSVTVDSTRLDVLLEDYLDEVSYYNKYHCIANHLPRCKRQPWFDCHKLLMMSHVLRLDLSAVLTLSIVTDIPIPVFLDGLEIRFGASFSRDQLSDLLHLPLFARTAIVNIIRRICRREIEEFKLLRLMVRKSALPELRQCSTPVDFETLPSFTGKGGFRHLAILKYYCECFDSSELVASQHTAAALREVTSDEGPYSELELELMKVLPDVPTRTTSMRDDEGKKGSYSSWVSLAARHSVVLLSRSKKCPSLTKAQTSKPMQDAYEKLLPVLQLAKMSYADLDIGLTGPRIDGRRGSAAGSGKGRVLRYGEGLPKGSNKVLSWNKMPPSSVYSFKNVNVAPLPADSPIRNESYESASNSMNDDLSSFGDSKMLGVMSHCGKPTSARVTDTLRRSNQSGERCSPASPIRASSREVFNLSSKGVNGYSADITWDSSFLLAPDSAIQSYNQTLQLTDGWRPLHHPPVVVQSPLRFKQVDVAALLRSSMDQPSCRDDISDINPEEVDELRLTVRSQGKHFSFGDGSLAQLSAVIEGSEIDNSTVGNAQKTSVSTSINHATSNELDAQAFAKKMERELLRDLGVGLQPSSSSVSPLRHRPGSNSNLNQQDKQKSLTASDKVHRLMKEMGSLRNTRDMDLYNEAMNEQAKEQRRQAIAKQQKQTAKQLKRMGVPVSYFPNSSVSTYGSTNEIQSASNRTLAASKSLDSTAWIRQAANDGKAALDMSVTKRVDAFLTDLHEQLSGEFAQQSENTKDVGNGVADDASLEGSTESKNTLGNNNVQGSGILQEYNDAIMMPISGSLHGSCRSNNALVPITDLLRSKYQYPHIYESTANVEWGAVSPGGKQLQPNWYPCPNKVIMRLNDRNIGVSSTLRSREADKNCSTVADKRRLAKQATLFKPPGLPSDEEAARLFTATRAMVHEPFKLTHVNEIPLPLTKEKVESSNPVDKPTTMPKMRPAYPEFEVTGTTPRPLSRRNRPVSSGIGSIPTPVEPVVVVSIKSSGDNASEGTLPERKDYSRSGSSRVLYVDDVFPEDISSSRDADTEMFELRNRFAEELVASMPRPSASQDHTPADTPARTPQQNQCRATSPIHDDHFEETSHATGMTDGMTDDIKSQSVVSKAASQADLEVTPLIPPPPIGRAEVAIGKKLLEPRYRGVEGHVSSRTHGQPAIGLSVLRPVTKTITLNRSFKVTVKPYQG